VVSHIKTLKQKKDHNIIEKSQLPKELFLGPIIPSNYQVETEIHYSSNNENIKKRMFFRSNAADHNDENDLIKDIRMYIQNTGSNNFKKTN
jgi:hypothetical protein